MNNYFPLFMVLAAFAVFGLAIYVKYHNYRECRTQFSTMYCLMQR